MDELKVIKEYFPKSYNKFTRMYGLVKIENAKKSIDVIDTELINYIQTYTKGLNLKVNEDYIKKWKNILPEKFVTLRWNGNPLYDQDLHRHLPFDQLLNTVKNNINNDVKIISLQIDENSKTVDGLINVQIDNWFDTIAIQKLALLNITSCTSTAHSAAAIGSPCIVMPPICTYYPWVYLKENKNSYWYGSNLKAFTQTKWKNWDIPMELLKKELEVLNA